MKSLTACICSVAVLATCFYFSVPLAQAADAECEVCVSVIKKFADTLSDEDRKSKDTIQNKLMKYCKGLKGKDERFCFFIGAKSDSATSTVGDVVKPLSYFMPAEKICEKLNVKDSQICELKYEKLLDLAEANFKNMKVKELKKILAVWGEDCKGCTEKPEFVARVEQLLPQYAPEDAKKRAAVKQEL